MVSDIPGNREWIQQGQQGWLFETGNTDELTELLVEFDKHQDGLKAIKLGNRLLAESHADWSRNFPVLLQAYEKAVELASGKAGNS
jgi:L-malate glycosyltransferase